MALKHILEDISSILGFDMTDADEQAYLVEQVNHAARELYNAMDLPGAIREQVFQIDDTDNYQVSFPFYVDKIRAIRFYNTYGGKIRLEDMRPRYHMMRWGNSGVLTFRIKRSDSALADDITNAGPLKFKLPTGKVEAAAVTITVVGKTASAERVQETVILAVGESEVSTVEGYEDVISIIKKDYNNYNITIEDIDGAELGIIPNSELQTAYTIVQIRQDDFSPRYNNNYPLNTIEVLYKQKFNGFRNLYDEFPCPKCDKIIFWKFAEHYLAYKPGMEQRSLGAKLKADELLGQLNTGDEMGKAIQIEYAPNPMLEAQRINPSVSHFGPSPQIEYLR